MKQNYLGVGRLKVVVFIELKWPLGARVTTAEVVGKTVEGSLSLAARISSTAVSTASARVSTRASSRRRAAVTTSLVLLLIIITISSSLILS